DHAHESPRVMTIPLVILAVFALGAGWHLAKNLPATIANFGVEGLLDQARPVGQLGDKVGVLMSNLVVPDELNSHIPEVKYPAGISAICVAVAGILGALVVYVWELVSVETLRRSLNILYRATWNKWWFDELYED